MKTIQEEKEEMRQEMLEESRNKEESCGFNKLIRKRTNCSILFSCGVSKDFKSEAHAIDYYHKHFGDQSCFFVANDDGEIKKIFRDEL